VLDTVFGSRKTLPVPKKKLVAIRLPGSLHSDSEARLRRGDVESWVTNVLGPEGWTALIDALASRSIGEDDVLDSRVDDAKNQTIPNDLSERTPPAMNLRLRPGDAQSKLRMIPEQSGLRLLCQGRRRRIDASASRSDNFHESVRANVPTRDDDVTDVKILGIVSSTFAVAPTEVVDVQYFSRRSLEALMNAKCEEGSSEMHQGICAPRNLDMIIEEFLDRSKATPVDLEDFSMRPLVSGRFEHKESYNFDKDPRVPRRIKPDDVID